MIRYLLGAVGLMSIGYGVLLLTDNPLPTLARIVAWAGVGVLLHDFVFAPLVTALGYAGRRILPRRAWTPIAVAALVSVTLLLLAIPVFDTPGARPTNPTVLDRDYPTGLLVALVVVWGCALLCLLLPVRQNQVIDQQRSDHIDRQPPSV